MQFITPILCFVAFFLIPQGLVGLMCVMAYMYPELEIVINK